MDPERIVQALKGTLDPDQREAAEKLLTETHKIIGFTPTLLQIVVEEALDLAIRQSAVVYLKNIINTSWKEREADKPGDPIPFSIHEKDKEAIRNHVMEAIVATPATLQTHLNVALRKILEIEFPEKMQDIPEKIRTYLSSDNQYQWKGALLALTSLNRTFEFMKLDDRGPINQTMGVLLPIIYEMAINLMKDDSDQSLGLQKDISKIFFVYTRYHLPLEILEKQSISRWIDLFRVVLDDCSKTDNDDPKSPWWKRKKWAISNLCRIFDRYGNPGGVVKKYNEFADWYLKSFSVSVLGVLLKILSLHREKVYISPCVLAQSINYTTTALGHSFAWKFLQPHFALVVQGIVFPLLCHNEEEEELWTEDPLEYIRLKASEYVMNSSPCEAATVLLQTACTKRRGVLDNTMQFAIQILNAPAETADVRAKDGAMHVIGSVAKVLLKRKAYKNHMETFLVNHVLPTFDAPEGFRRARACWLLGKLATVEFQDASVLLRGTELTKRAMFVDSELPVRALAAMCLFELLHNQEKTHAILLPQLKELIMQLLKLLRETEFDGLNDVLSTLLLTYSDEIIPIAVQMMQCMSTTYRQLLRITENGEVSSDHLGDFTQHALTNGNVNGQKLHTSGMDGDISISNNEEVDDDEVDYRSMIATGVLENVESLLCQLSSNTELMLQLEPVLVNLVQTILRHSLSDHVEEALSFVYTLTSESISPRMWHVFEWIHQIFEDGSRDSFSEMMSSLHNYICVDREAFLADPKRLETVIDMCSKVLADDELGEIIQQHAAKLFEVIIINHTTKVEAYVPKFIELALARLTRPILQSDLKTMCLQVVIAGIIYTQASVLPILSSHNWPGTERLVLDEFMTQWMQEMAHFFGLHDRRVAVLGLCCLLSMPSDQRPSAVANLHKEFIPSLLVLLNGLKRAYARNAEENAEDDSLDNDDDDDDDDDDDEAEDKALASDEDDVDEESAQYLELLESKECDVSDDDDDDNEFDSSDYKTPIEMFDTDIDKEENEMDEFIVFYRVMTQLESSDTAWYQHLVTGLTDAQQTELKEIVDTAVKCMHQKDSKRIEQSGGYNFSQITVPQSFNFGPSQPPS